MSGGLNWKEVWVRIREKLRRRPLGGRATAAAAVLLVLEATLAAQARLDRTRIDAAAEAQRRQLKAPGLAVVLVAGDQVYTQGYGVRRAGSPETVTPRTLFAVGSVTKSFTALAAALLVEEGRLEWDKPVREYLPWFRLQDPAASEMITVRDLLAHRSGLPRYDFLRFAVPLPRDELVRRLRYLAPTAGFRERYQYQNLMYTAAGYLSGVLAGTSWEEVIEKRIFGPLGMHGSTVRVADTQKTTDYAAPHAGGAPVEFYDYQKFGVGPNGAVNTTAGDLARYLRFHLGDGSWEGRRLLSQQTLAELHRPQMVVDDWSAYGLGWNVSWPDGARLISHGGAITGFRAWAGFVPERKEAVAVLVNCSCDADGAARALAGQLLGWKLRGGAAGRLAQRAAGREPVNGPPSRPLESYAGRYEHPAFGPSEVALRNGKLEVRFPALVVALEHERFDYFRNPGGGADAQFVMDASGEFAEMRLKVDPAAPPVVFLRKR